MYSFNHRSLEVWQEAWSVHLPELHAERQALVCDYESEIPTMTIANGNVE